MEMKNPEFPEQERHQKCPRCESNNTKFCYYNNYNLTQPRHFCKNCRRYWTKGGTLRNIPIGGKITKPKNKPKTSSFPNKPQPPLPQKQEPCVKYDGFGNDQRAEFNGESSSSQLRSNNYSMGPFGNLLMDHSLSSTLLVNKPDEDVFIRNPIEDDLRTDFFRLNANNNNNPNGESSCCWSWSGGDLSIFTPDSTFF